jgi:hypothetical protein
MIIKIDQIWKRFLWDGPDALKRKYHLVNWTIVCRPTEYGDGGC